MLGLRRRSVASGRASCYSVPSGLGGADQRDVQPVPLGTDHQRLSRRAVRLGHHELVRQRLAGIPAHDFSQHLVPEYVVGQFYDSPGYVKKLTQGAFSRNYALPLCTND